MEKNTNESLLILLSVLIGSLAVFIIIAAGTTLLRVDKSSSGNRSKRENRQEAIDQDDYSSSNESVQTKSESEEGILGFLSKNSNTSGSIVNELLPESDGWEVSESGTTNLARGLFLVPVGMDYDYYPTVVQQASLNGNGQEATEQIECTAYFVKNYSSDMQHTSLGTAYVSPEGEVVYQGRLNGQNVTYLRLQ